MLNLKLLNKNMTRILLFKHFILLFFRMYSTPDVEKRFRHQLQAVEAWWNAQTQMRLPGPAQRAPPALPAAFDDFDDDEPTASAA